MHQKPPSQVTQDSVADYIFVIFSKVEGVEVHYGHLVQQIHNSFATITSYTVTFKFAADSWVSDITLYCSKPDRGLVAERYVGEWSPSCSYQVMVLSMSREAAVVVKESHTHCQAYSYMDIKPASHYFTVAYRIAHHVEAPL